MTQDGLLNHVEINVSDLDAAVAFYDWFLSELGYAPHQEWDQGRSWRLGATYLVVVQVEPRYKEPSFHRRRAGLNHLAFHAGSPERVDWMRDRLTERGVTVLYDSPTRASVPYALYFEGPDRLKLEYVWEPPASV